LTIRQLTLRATALAAAVAVAGSAALAQTAAPATIRVVASAGDDLLPFWYAQSTGMFRAAGLNVVLDKAASGAVATQAIVGGADDIGRVSLISLVSAHVRGIPFVLIAPAAIHRKQTSVNDGVLVAAGAPYRSVTDLQGKTVSSTELGSIGALGLRALIDAQGGDSSTLHWVELPVSAAAAALEAGRIDAGISNEPSLSRDLAGGKVRVLADMLDGYRGEILEGAYFSMRDYAVANRDAVARFTRVLREASVYANAHVNDLLSLLIANTALDPDVAARMHHALIGVSFDPSQVQPVVDVAAKYGVIPHGFDAREMFLR
jgi:NitT/TauT family transport system substrate-binding protein